MSLIGSSAASDRSREIDELDVEESIIRQSDEWDGVKTIYGSPLSDAIKDDSKDISAQDLGDAQLDPTTPQEMPSVDLELPEDVSNLLSVSMTGPPDVSNLLSVTMGGQSDLSNSMISTSCYLSTPRAPMRPSPLSQEISRSVESSISYSTFLQHSSMTDVLVPQDLNADTPISVPASFTTGISSPGSEGAAPTPVSSPTPGVEAYTSIFADMSAEQAIHSWPLPVPHGVSPSPMTDRGSPSPQSTPSRPSEASANTPRSAADTTQFYDCTTTLYSPPTRAQDLRALIAPTQAMFDAHNARSSALQSELDLYKALAERLQAEVSERDAALTELNIRIVETDLTEQRDSGALLRGGSKRTPSPQDRSSSRGIDSPITEAMQARSAKAQIVRSSGDDSGLRDLEIRLQKALAENRSLQQTLSEEITARGDMEQAILDRDSSLPHLQDQQRDAMIMSRQKEGTLRDHIAQMGAQIEALRRDLVVRDGEIANERRRLETADQDLQAALQDRDHHKAECAMRSTLLQHMDAEISRTNGELNKADAHIREESEERHRLELLNADVSCPRVKRESTHRSQITRELRQARAHLEALKTSPSESELIARLRSESASKDLEILNLQRRKAELREDKEMLNIALDSKQQELELVRFVYQCWQAALTCGR